VRIFFVLTYDTKHWRNLVSISSGDLCRKELEMPCIRRIISSSIVLVESKSRRQFLHRFLMSVLQKNPLMIKSQFSHLYRMLSQS
jgi:hypothetical protein